MKQNFKCMHYQLIMQSILLEAHRAFTALKHQKPSVFKFKLSVQEMTYSISESCDAHTAMFNFVVWPGRANVFNVLFGLISLIGWKSYVLMSMYQGKWMEGFRLYYQSNYVPYIGTSLFCIFQAEWIIKSLVFRKIKHLLALLTQDQ